MFFLLRVTDKEKNKFFRDFIYWKEEGLDIDKYHCLLINFGAHLQFDNPQIRKVIVMFLKDFLKFKTFCKNLVFSMTLQGEISLLDSFTHTIKDHEKIMNFDFIKDNSTKEREKIMIEETFCTLVAVGGKFLEKKTFKKALKKIDEIRIIIRTEPFKKYCIIIT